MPPAHCESLAHLLCFFEPLGKSLSPSTNSSYEDPVTHLFIHSCLHAGNTYSLLGAEGTMVTKILKISALVGLNPKEQ